MKAVESPSRWIGRHRPEPAAAVRLYCFPHAGGGPAFFRGWGEALAPEVEVLPVLLPGREGRFREPALRTMEEMIEPLCTALEGEIRPPYALFGHSMGAVIAFEVARRFLDTGVGAPEILFISGRRAPHLPARRAPIAHLSDDDFIAAIAGLNGTPPAVLEQRDLLLQFLPTIRADFHLNDSYEPLSRPPKSPGSALAMPISALVGDSDPEVQLREIAAWRQWTTAGFRWRVMSGDHFYLQGGRREVLDAVARDLKQRMEQGGGG